MRELVSRIRALRRLRGPGELAQLLHVVAVAAAAPRLMRLPLHRAAGLLTRPPSTRVPDAAEIERLDRLATLAPRVANPLVRPGCLTRGLTLFVLLRRAGLDVELRFGLEVDGAAGTDGHCWLVLDDAPYLEPVDPRPRFAETLRLPLPTR